MTTKKQIIEAILDKFDEHRLQVKVVISLKHYINKEEYKLKTTRLTKSGYRIFSRNRWRTNISSYETMRKETLLEICRILNNI